MQLPEFNVADCENVRVFFSSISANRLAGERTFSFFAAQARETCGATPSFYGPTQEAPFATVHWLVY